MMIRWWEHGKKGVTDRQTDRQTDRRTDRQTENTICRAAWSQLITVKYVPMNNYMFELLNIRACSFIMFRNLGCSQSLVVSCKYWVVPLIFTRVSGYSRVILLESSRNVSEINPWAARSHRLQTPTLQQPSPGRRNRSLQQDPKTDAKPTNIPSTCKYRPLQWVNN